MFYVLRALLVFFCWSVPVEFLRSFLLLIALGSGMKVKVAHPCLQRSLRILSQVPKVAPHLKHQASIISIKCCLQYSRVLTKHLNKQLIKDYPADCALTKVLLLHPLQVLLLLLRLPCDLLQQVLDNFWLTKKILS